MKKVAIDISSISFLDNGITRFTKNIVAEMIKNKNCFFYIFSNSNAKFFKNKKNIKVIQSNLKFKGSMLIWQQLILPILLFKYKIDILWCPTHRVPVFKILKYKIYVTIHDVVSLRFPQTMKYFGKLIDKILLPIAIKNANKVICVSRFTKKELEFFFPNYKNKFELSYPGSNLIKKKLNKIKKNEKNLFKKNKFFIFVGTIEPRKNIEKLIFAYSSLLKKNLINLNFFIIGNQGWGHLRLDDLIKSLNLDKNVFWFKNIDDKSLANFYYSCEFLALPSIYEGFGLPVLEALTFNKKVLISENSPMQEIYCKFGITVNPYSVKSIENGLLYITKNKFEKQKSFLKDNLKKFSWLNCAKKHSSIMKI